MDDLYWLENKDAIIQKVANESAAQMSLFIKQKNSNINLNTTATPQPAINSNSLGNIQNELAAAAWK